MVITSSDTAQQSSDFVIEDLCAVCWNVAGRTMSFTLLVPKRDAGLVTIFMANKNAPSAGKASGPKQMLTLTNR